MFCFARRPHAIRPIAEAVHTIAQRCRKAHAYDALGNSPHSLSGEFSPHAGADLAPLPHAALSVSRQRSKGSTAPIARARIACGARD
jgi:hypothetical protein